MWKMIPCSIYRGGTSKAIFVLEDDLPKDPVRREQILLSMIGAKDIHRRDGIGGSTVPTSKIVVVNKSNRKGTDVEYTHGQVSLNEEYIDYEANGGNISFAVAPFAIHKGIIGSDGDRCKVNIYNTNTEQYMNSYFQLERNEREGIKLLPEEPLIEMEFLHPSGNKVGKLLPTGSTKDILYVQQRKIPVTIIDSGNLTIIVHAQELGLEGAVTSQSELIQVSKIMEELRVMVSNMLNLYNKDTDLSNKVLPKIAIIKEPFSYTSTSGELINKNDVSIVARDITTGTLHPSYPVTGAICAWCGFLNTQYDCK